VYEKTRSMTMDWNSVVHY